MTFKSLFTKVVAQARPAYSRFLAKHLQVDMETCVLRLSNETFQLAVCALANRYAPEAAFTMERTGAGWAVSAIVDKHRVASVIQLQSVRFSHGVVSVTVRTPAGATIEGRPLVSFVVRLIARFFGGTSVGLSLLSRLMPGSATWDGQVATCEVRLVEEDDATDSWSTLEATTQVTQEEEMMAFSFDNSAALAQVGRLAARQVLAALLSRIVGG